MAEVIDVVKPYGGEPDWKETRARLIKALLRIEELREFREWRRLNNPAIALLRHFSPDDHEVLAILAKAHRKALAERACIEGEDAP